MNFAPAVAIVVVGASAGMAMRSRIAPRTEALGLAVLAGLAELVGVAGLALTTILFLGRFPQVAGLLGWCERLTRTVPWWVGLPASFALSVLVTATIVVTGRFVRARPRRGAPGVVVVDTAQPMAYSLAGRGGQIVVSAGMLDELDSDERRVLFAHEAAHLRLRHHRLLWLGDIAALNPLLRPVRARLRFAVERWADEESVRAVGDRELVARAITRAALVAAGATPAGSLRMNGSEVVARVEALLSPTDVTSPTWAGAAGLLALLTGLVYMAVQWPLVAELSTHLCHV